MMNISQRLIVFKSKRCLVISKAFFSASPTSTVIYTWGVGTKGELGHQSFNTKSGMMEDSYIQIEPRRLLKSKKFRKLACGSNYTLAICDAGQLYGWGEGFVRNQKSKEPQLIPMSSEIVEISAGIKHAAAVDKAGQVYTWGHGGDWKKGGGQLGHGNTQAQDFPKVIELFREYNVRVRNVCCAGHHTLILTDDGEVLACGVGEYGRLGTGSTEDALTPVSLLDLADYNIVQVVAGQGHSIALSSDGIVFSWGRNDSGQLGHQDTVLDMYSMNECPTIIEALMPKNIGNGAQVVQLAAAKGRSAALTSDGRMYIWGARLNHVPTLVDPTLFGNKAVVKVSIGGFSAQVIAMLTTDGALWTMGDSSSHMLGHPIESRFSKFFGFQSLIPIIVPVLKDHRVVDVFCGPGQHMAALVETPSQI